MKITGRVQGVGFRWFVQRAASGLGLAGTVRNMADGSVEVRAEGDESALRSLLEAVRSGPAGARVTSIDEQWGEGTNRYRGFHIGD